MLSISKNPNRLWPVILTVGATLAIWIGSKIHYQDWFDDPFKYPAKAASLSAVSLMWWGVILSTRSALMEGLFGGLDKVYQVHKRIGRWSFFVILLHPIFLSAHNLPSLSKFVVELAFLYPDGSAYIWGHNLGVAVLILMTSLMIITLWVRIPYDKWKKTHEWFGLVLFMVAVHVFLVDRDVAAYPILRYWLWSMMVSGIGAFVYIRFLYRSLGPRFPYSVSDIVRKGDVLTLSLTPKKDKMDYKPSQFVYLVVDKKGISREPHPYSIASGYNLDCLIRLGIKMVGDHTRTLVKLAPNDDVTLYGPYGRFSDRFLAGERDCIFVGGGIGITPFLGMWHVALHSEERMDSHEVPERLKALHPEIIKGWRSPLVYLFYVCRRQEEAYFDEDIREEIYSSHLLGFREFEKRGHYYELYLTSIKGRITGGYMALKVEGGVANKNVFLCGPSSMVSSLFRQLKEMGVPETQIIVEDFNLI